LTSKVQVRHLDGLHLGCCIGGGDGCPRHLPHPGRKSNAEHGYPHDGDLHLTRQLVINPTTGEYEMEKDQTPKVIDRGLLIRWSEVEYLDIQEY
jgi:hypothetical protein